MDGGAGWAKQTMAYNDAGELAEQAYLDAEGNPVNLKDGYARMEMAYDGSGVLHTTYYDASGNEVSVG